VSRSSATADCVGCGWVISENLTGHHLRAKFWESFMTDKFLKLAIFVGSVALLAVLTLAFA
jgi:hypothetical protein